MAKTDQVFFLDLYHTYVDQLRIYAMRQFHDPYLAEDLAHETMLTAWEKILELQKQAHPIKWLYKVLHYKCYREFSRKRRKAEILWEEPVLEKLSTDLTSDVLEILPAGLSPDHKQLLIWQYQEQRSYIEIAARLEISEYAARKRVERVVKRCRNLLQEHNQ